MLYCLYLQLARVLSKVDQWAFDTFALEEAAGGRPLSVLAFALIKRADMVRRFDLDETKLARLVGWFAVGWLVGWLDSMMICTHQAGGQARRFDLNETRLAL
jgi:hypothetical protein